MLTLYPQMRLLDKSINSEQCLNLIWENLRNVPWRLWSVKLLWSSLSYYFH